MIAARYVAAGRYGRKSGRGYYDYGAGAGQHRSEDPAPLDGGSPGHGEGVVVISGDGVLAQELRATATQAGYEVRSPHAPTGGVLPALVLDCDGAPAPQDAERAPQADGRTAARHTSLREARAWCCARRDRSALWTRAAARSASTSFRPCNRPGWSS